jgi:alpha-ketoglutarate-dependent taurine dioxygenase
VLTHAVSGPRAWQADTVDDRAAWYYPLPRRCLPVLDLAVADFRTRGGPVTELVLAPEERADWGTALAPVRWALEEGRGFVVVEPPAGRYAEEDLPAVYWLVGQGLGRPVAQNVQGTLLYDVRDTGQDVRYGARFSVTNAESSFHTDSSFADRVADYVGLLCLKAARSGGLSQVVSGYSAHNELLAEHPGALEVLYRPVHVDRRGGVRPGEAPTAHVPVLAWEGGGLVYRYLRYWIEAGHEKAGEPLTGAQRAALDVLDEVLHRPELRVEFALKPGDMFFANNRWVLHNRTAFEDHPEPRRRRHLLRLWLEARG